MAITATTLSSAVKANDTTVGLASATGVTAPTPTTGVGFTYLFVEQEMMFVTAITGTVASVLRGQLGTQAVAHPTAAPVFIGAPSDFPGFTPAQGTSVELPNEYMGVGAPLTGATIAPAVGQSVAHFTGSTALVTITVPTGMQSGRLTLIFDGTGSGLTWTAADNIAVAGTATTAKSAVTFLYDPSTSKWIPNRLA